MSTSSSTGQNTTAHHRSPAFRLLMGGTKILVSVALIVAAIMVYRHQIRTGPRARRMKPPTREKLVQVIPLQREDCTASVKAMGTVAPAQQVTLRSQVTGPIVELAPQVIPGGIVREGELLARIDPRDYEVVVEQRLGNVAKALEQLKVEQGNQAVAKQEYELLGEVVTEQDRELLLREPQLASAQSALESAQAALQKAQLDLDRCQIRSPFNAIVQEKHADVGAVVGLNTDLVTLIGTDEAWIEVMARVDELQWFDIPERNSESGSLAAIRNDKVWGSDRVRTGRVVRLGAELETQARWAQILVTVEDPFCLQAEHRDLPQLLMGTYVAVTIQGRSLDNVFAIPWSYLRDNNTVWIMNADGKLEIRPVQIVLIQEDRVFVTQGLRGGEFLVITDLAAPVVGMPLRVAETEDHDSPQDRPIPGITGDAQ